MRGKKEKGDRGGRGEKGGGKEGRGEEGRGEQEGRRGGEERNKSRQEKRRGCEINTFKRKISVIIYMFCRAGAEKNNNNHLLPRLPRGEEGRRQDNRQTTTRLSGNSSTDLFVLECCLSVCVCVLMLLG